MDQPKSPEDQAQAQASRKSTGNPPAIVNKKVSNKLNTDEPNANGGKPPDEENRLMWIGHLFLEPSFTDWAIAAFTIVIAIVGYFQWKTIGGQLTEMRKAGTQTDQLISQYRKQVENMEASVRETHALAVAAQTADKQAERALRIQTRPWVDAGVALIEKTDDRSLIKFQVIMENGGQGPALYLSLIQQNFVLPRKTVRESDFPKNSRKVVEDLGHVVGQGVLLPHDTGKGLVIEYEVTPNKLNNGKYWLYAGGEVTYQDVFNQRHVTHFCYRLDENSFHMCNAHNDMN